MFKRNKRYMVSLSRPPPSNLVQLILKNSPPLCLETILKSNTSPYRRKKIKLCSWKEYRFDFISKKIGTLGSGKIKIKRTPSLHDII